MNGIKVLIVDDEENVRQLCRIALSHSGITADTAETAEEGMAMFNENRYPVIVLDNILPGMNGVDMLAKIKKLSPDTKVIMYSGCPTLQFEMESIHNGADNFISKPIEIEKLKTVVSQSL